jgi:hypothetical protein
LTWLVPDIEGLPTGGNVYNRRILEALPEDVPATITTWPVGESAEEPPLPDVDPAGAGAGRPVVVDSLCLQQAGALRDLREAHPDARLILLAHYLHCVDPRKTGSPAANAERTLLPLFDRAVTPSRYVADALSDEGLPADPVSPGLDAAYREPTVPPPATGGAPQLLTVANVLPGKGLDVLLDALTALRDLDWTWRLVGSGELDAECAEAFRDRLANSGLGDRVCWDGPVPGDAMPRVYDACDVFVLPTRFETCSLSTREAMARGGGRWWPRAWAASPKTSATPQPGASSRRATRRPCPPRWPISSPTPRRAAPWDAPPAGKVSRSRPGRRRPGGLWRPARSDRGLRS